MDTFTVNWVNEVNWWVLPLHLVCRTVHHASNCNAKGTLVNPVWKSAPFWPVLFPDSEHLAPFFHLWWSVQYSPGLIVQGHSGSTLGSSLTLDTMLLALFIDISVQPRHVNLGFHIA